MIIRRISKTQWCQLTEEQQIKFLDIVKDDEWWSANEDSKKRAINDGEEETTTENLIQFIREYHNVIDINLTSEFLKNKEKRNKWIVLGYNRKSSADKDWVFGKPFFDESLIEALWKLCVYILKNNIELINK